MLTRKEIENLPAMESEKVKEMQSTSLYSLLFSMLIQVIVASFLMIGEARNIPLLPQLLPLIGVAILLAGHSLSNYGFSIISKENVKYETKLLTTTSGSLFMTLGLLFMLSPWKLTENKVIFLSTSLVCLLPLLMPKLTIKRKVQPQ